MTRTTLNWAELFKSCWGGNRWVLTLWTSCALLPPSFMQKRVNRSSAMAQGREQRSSHSWSRCQPVSQAAVHAGSQSGSYPGRKAVSLQGHRRGPSANLSFQQKQLPYGTTKKKRLATDQQISRLSQDWPMKNS